jgi:hypothetical protein
VATPERQPASPEQFELRPGPYRIPAYGMPRVVPVVTLRDYSGEPCTRIVRTGELALERMGTLTVPDSDAELGDILKSAWTMDPAKHQLSDDFTCCLGEGWRFDEVEHDAKRRDACRYSGTSQTGIENRIVLAVHDLERAFQRHHPKAPCAAVADFWRSWQVQQHIAEFCGTLAKSPTAAALIGKIDAAEQVEHARRYVYRRLAVFAHEASIAGEPVAPKTVEAAPRGSSQTAKTKRLSGFKPDMKKHRAIARIVERHAPRWRAPYNSWRDRHLRPICADLDNEAVEIPETWTKGKPVALNGAPVRSWTETLELAGTKLVADQIKTSLKAVLKSEGFESPRKVSAKSPQAS